MNRNRNSKRIAVIAGLVLSASALMGGCSSGDDAAKIDPTKQNDGGVVAALEVTGTTKLAEEEGSIDSVGSVGETVNYTFTVTSKAKGTLTEVGVSTTEGEMWCTDESGKSGKALDLEPGKKLTCSTDALPAEATKDESVAKPHKITATDVTNKVFEVIAKGHGKDATAKSADARIVVAEPIALKVATVVKK